MRMFKSTRNIYFVFQNWNNFCIDEIALTFSRRAMKNYKKHQGELNKIDFKKDRVYFHFF